MSLQLRGLDCGGRWFDDYGPEFLVSSGPPVLSRARSRRTRCSSVFDAEFVEALVLSLGQHKDDDEEAKHADHGGHRLGGEKPARAQQDRK
jgi:hypothetical protein